MTAPTPAPDAPDTQRERLAVALAKASDDDRCFDRTEFTDEEWAAGAGEEDREWFRDLADAALAVVRDDTTTALARVDGVALITAERQRQVQAEGWTPEHDAEHRDDALAMAAAVYALPAARRGRRSIPHPGNNGDRGDAWRYVPAHWPWDPEWYKPTPDDRVRELVKAGALIAAEIDRLRAAIAGESR